MLYALAFCVNVGWVNATWLNLAKNLGPTTEKQRKQNFSGQRYFEIEALKNLSCGVNLRQGLSNNPTSASRLHHGAKHDHPDEPGPGPEPSCGVCRPQHLPSVGGQALPTGGSLHRRRLSLRRRPSRSSPTRPFGRQHLLEGDPG